MLHIFIGAFYDAGILLGPRNTASSKLGISSLPQANNLTGMTTHIYVKERETNVSPNFP